MIHGITASVAAGGASLSGTVLDFVAGTYRVEGTSYAVTDLLETGFMTDGTTPAGAAFTAGAVLAGYGLPVNSVNNVQPRAKGPLLALLSAPCTVLVEFEDQESYFNGFFDYTKGPDCRANFYGAPSVISSIYWSDGQASSALGWPTYRAYGTNRIAWTIGTALGGVSANGIASVDTGNNGQDSSGFFAQWTAGSDLAQVFPFGSLYGTGPSGVLIRKLTVYPQARIKTYAELPALSALLDDPFDAGTHTVTLASATSSSLTLAINPAPTAALEYFIAKTYHWSDPNYRAPGPRYYLDHPWRALPESKTISTRYIDGVEEALQAATQYTIYLRSARDGAAGSAGCLDATSWNFTATA